MPYVSERVPAIQRDTEILLWRPPAIEPAPAVKDYRLERREDLMTTWQPVVSVAPPTTRYIAPIVEEVEPSFTIYTETHIGYYTPMDYQATAYAEANIGEDELHLSTEFRIVVFNLSDSCFISAFVKSFPSDSFVCPIIYKSNCLRVINTM